MAKLRTVRLSARPKTKCCIKNHGSIKRLWVHNVKSVVRTEQIKDSCGQSTTMGKDVVLHHHIKLTLDVSMMSAFSLIFETSLYIKTVIDL